MNNPRRVPPLLETVDQPQEGLPRVIHPITSLRLEPGMEREDTDYVVVEEDVTKLSDDKRDSIQFAKGQRIHRSVAVRFGFLAGAAVVAPRSPDARADPNLIENRMERVPEDRDGVVVDPVIQLRDAETGQFVDGDEPTATTARRSRKRATPADGDDAGDAADGAA